MLKKTKIWLIIATVLLVVGLVMFSLVMSALNWDFTKLSTSEFYTNTHNISQEFSNISINTDTADISFVASENLEYKVVCHEEENTKHTLNIKDGTLFIKAVDKRKWYNYVGVNFSTPKITVFIPQGEYGKLAINSSTSDIKIPKEFKFQNIDISLSTGDVINYASALDDIKIKVSTGDININNVSCGNFVSNGSTGDISLKNVIATEKFSIKRSTGDINFDGCDAKEIFVETDTGSVSGSLLSNKVFKAESDTGYINVPKTVSGGRCEIITDTGDIKITYK